MLEFTTAIALVTPLAGAELGTEVRSVQLDIYTSLNPTLESV